MIDYFACSIKSKNRAKNEDRVLAVNKVISDGNSAGKADHEFIAIVCDGVGGNSGGEVAAETVVSGFKDYCIKTASASSIMQDIGRLNQDILKKQKEEPKHCNMATTASGVLIWDDRYIMFNIGDTRIYELKDDKLLQKTRDDSINNALTYYIGGPGNACYPSIIQGRFADRYKIIMICSDGVYKKTTNEEMRDILASDFSLEEKAKAILSKAAQNGSTDDMSIVLLNYSSELSSSPNASSKTSLKL